MCDENHDPSSNLLQAKMRPKPVDARSAAASSLISSSGSPKSATITNVSQRLPSTSVEVSVGEILSTDEKRASVSVREEQPHYLSSSCSSLEAGDNSETTLATTDKIDLGEATRELTRLLHIGNDNITHKVQLNPDAPNFTPIDFSPTYRSELAPAHLRRRATQIDYHHHRYLRSRYYSESHPYSLSAANSPIRPLLSLVPQRFPYNRQTWTATTESSTSNSWWQQDYSNLPNLSSSYHSKPTYSLYSSLISPLTDGSLYSNIHSSKRQRIHSNRAFVFPSHTTTNRKRSYSGPEVPLKPPPTHLNGIHALTKIMIDILRMIEPLPIGEEKTQKQGQHRRCSQQQKQNESSDMDVFVDDEILTITASIDKLSGNLYNQNTLVIDSFMFFLNNDTLFMIELDS